MPTTPAADPTQKTLLTSLTTLAQTDATTTGNQISILNTQIATYQQGQALFQSRYDYWDQFVSGYALERRYLDGNYQATPLVTADFTSFSSQSGRLWNASAAEPGRYAPQRIAEFDGGNLTYDLASDETSALTSEALWRGNLASGIATTGLIGGVTTNQTLTTSSTSLQVKCTSAVTIPLRDYLVLGSGTAAVVVVTAVTLTQTGGTTTDPMTMVVTTTPYIYTLTVSQQSIGFSSILTGALFLDVIPGFTNPERTNKTASNHIYQPVLAGFVSTYTAKVTAWKTILQNQRSAITGDINEDQPDATYVANQLATLNQLTSYLTSVDVSDTGLSANHSLNTARVSANAARLTYIASRLSTILPTVSPYDQRYNYANRLYNLSDGALTTVKILTAQREALAGQQSTSNARAATYAAENF